MQLADTSKGEYYYGSFKVRKRVEVNATRTETYEVFIFRV